MMHSLSDHISIFRNREPFVFESGAVIPELEIAYQTWGTMKPDGSNVVWVCHALTANSNAVDWWNGVIGAGKPVDPAQHFIVCANIIGSCYGSSGPISLDPTTGKPFYLDFPTPSIRDMVRAFILLRKHLGISKIELLMGGSMGGYQVLEWAILEPACIQQLFLIATSPAESAWGQAIHAAQRMAIEADPSWKEPHSKAGQAGLMAARAIGMLTYRNYDIMVQRQQEPDPEKTSGFKAESYMRYQGTKLAQRFHVQSYYLLTRSMDAHHLARGRGGSLPEVLMSIQHPTLIIGISSDILCPVAEQKLMAGYMPNAVFQEMDSDFGHDGFLVEGEKISEALQHFLASN